MAVLVERDRAWWGQHERCRPGDIPAGMQVDRSAAQYRSAMSARNGLAPLSITARSTGRHGDSGSALGSVNHDELLHDPTC